MLNCCTNYMYKINVPFCRKYIGIMSSKAKCNYWEKCYRKDATHLAEFLHPGDVKESKKETKKEEKGKITFHMLPLC